MANDTSRRPRPRRSWAPRIALALFCLAAIAVIWVTNVLLTERFTEATRTRTDVRLTWLSENQKLWLAFWARNLEDEAAKTNQEIQNDIYRVHYYDLPFRAGFQAGFQY